MNYELLKENKLIVKKVSNLSVLLKTAMYVVQFSYFYI